MGLSKSKSKKYDVAGLQSRADGDGSIYGSIKSNSRRDYLNVINSPESDLDIINKHESREDKLIGVEKPSVEKEIVDRVNQFWQPKAEIADGAPSTANLETTPALNTNSTVNHARSRRDDEITIADDVENEKSVPEKIHEESREAEKSKKEALIEEFNSNLSEIEKDRSDFVHEMLQEPSKIDVQEHESLKSDELTFNVNSVINELEAIATTQKDLMKGEQEEVKVDVVSVDVEGQKEVEEEKDLKKSGEGEQSVEIVSVDLESNQKQLEAEKDLKEDEEEEKSAGIISFDHNRLDKENNNEVKKGVHELDALDQPSKQIQETKEELTMNCDPLDQPMKNVEEAKEEVTIKCDALDQPLKRIESIKETKEELTIKCESSKAPEETEEYFTPNVIDPLDEITFPKCIKPTPKEENTKCDPLDDSPKSPKPETCNQETTNGKNEKIDPLDQPTNRESTSLYYDANGCAETDEEEIVQISEKSIFLTDGERLAYLNTINEIQKDARKLREAAELFEGKRDDVQYVYLNEMFLRCLLKLDSVMVSDAEVKKLKKKASEYVQECMKLLDNRSTGSEGDIRVAF